MAELADARDSKSRARKGMRVRLPPSAFASHLVERETRRILCGPGVSDGQTNFFFFFDGSCDIIQLCNIGSPSILKKRYCANDPT